MQEEAKRRYGSRKFIVTISAFAGAFVLAMMGKNGTDFAAVAAAGLIGYNIANAYTTGPPK